MAVKVDRAGIHESHHGEGLVTQDRQMKGTTWRLENHPAGTRHGIDSVTDHLRTECRETLAEVFVGHVVQRDPIPDSGLANRRYQRVTNFGERDLECPQPLGLLWGDVEPQADHGNHCISLADNIPI